MRSIRQQLTRKLLLSFVLLLGICGTVMYLLIRSALVSEFDGKLRAKAEALATLTEDKEGRVDIDFSDDIMREFERGGTDFFELWSSDGKVVARSESLKKRDLPNRFGTLEAPEYWNTELRRDIHCRAAGIKFVPQLADEERTSDKRSGAVVLVVASHRADLDKTLALLGIGLASSGLALLMGTVLLVPRVLRKELVPLDQLAEQTAGITADSLGKRFPTGGLPEELAPITGKLNELLARLEQSFERERQFSGDLAHELRTPIAELRSLAELALKWPENRDPATDRETLAIAQQMEGIVTRLLALLRSERGQLAVKREPVDLQPLIDSVLQPVEQKAEAKKISVATDVPDSVQIGTDAVLLRSILTNLLENAIEYTPCGGSISAQARIEADHFQLAISNDVECLDPDDLPKLFDRFWRKDKSRSGTEHSGLGLSLARAFAQALQCELAAKLEGKRIVFTLSGPTAIQVAK